jgi:ESS family glutamate:Na+ symporter
LDALLATHLSAILGLVLNDLIADAGLQLPLFVTCLFAGIALTNIISREMRRVMTSTRWPSRTPAMALIADVLLGAFLAMLLMSMPLWTCRSHRAAFIDLFKALAIPFYLSRF